MDLAAKYFATKRSALRWAIMERRMAFWLQGWWLIAVLAFGVKAIFSQVPWSAVAGIAGVHLLLYVGLQAVNARRHVVERHMNEIDSKIASQGGV